MGKENLISLSMNLLAVASLNRLSLHVLVERTESGHFMASVPEILLECLREMMSLRNWRRNCVLSASWI